MDASNAKIDEALLDVRRAYRLLYDYQHMVLDAVQYIGRQFGLPYRGGWAKFSGTTPGEGKGPLNRSAWDWLNMVFYDFHFASEAVDGNSIRLSIILISDTGYFCAEDEMLSIADVFDYLKPEQSSTKVAFIISAREWGVEFLEDKSAMKNFIETSEELPKGTAEKGIIGKCVDLSRLASAEGTNRLLDELVLFAQANRIMLTRIGSKA